jgi:TolB-like protein/cytochrome c-type biogenesis protein CcmH/NrfG
MRFARSFMTVGVAAVLAGCASSGQTAGGGIAKLEATRAKRPDDPSVLRSLGLAYFKAGKLTEARATLEQAAKANPADGTTALYLGLTAEKQNDLPAAKAAYQSYVRYGRTSKVRRQLEDRLAALTRQELTLLAKSSVAREQQLATQTGSPKTVAVMPLRFIGQDTTLQPLERGFAELITTDLSHSHELVVVERAKIQALLDEIKLQQSGATDPATNVRAGKIIQAGRIVNGQIAQTEQRLRVDAAIVNTTTSALAGGAANENTMEELFAIEKAIVKQLFDSLGVTLTSDEKKALDLTPTRSLPAFLAYSKGLMLEDQGKFDEASRSYRDAVRIDPGFSAAQSRSSATASVAVGAAMTPNAMESSLAGTPEEQAAQDAQQGQAPPPQTENSPSNQADNLNSSQAAGATNSAGAGGTNNGSTGSTTNNQPNKDPLGAATGAEGKSSSATIKIVVKIPHP